MTEPKTRFAYKVGLVLALAALVAAVVTAWVALIEAFTHFAFDASGSVVVTIAALWLAILGPPAVLGFVIKGRKP